MPTVKVYKNEWFKIVETARAELGERLPIDRALWLYSLCPVSLFTPLSIELWNLYQCLEGTKRLRTPSEYYTQPAIWSMGCQIIDRELARIEQERQRDGDKKRKYQADNIR